MLGNESVGRRAVIGHGGQCLPNAIQNSSFNCFGAVFTHARRRPFSSFPCLSLGLICFCNSGVLCCMDYK